MTKKSFLTPGALLLQGSMAAALLLSSGCVYSHDPDPNVYPKPPEGFFGRRTQVPLRAEKADVAVIFVGGFAGRYLTRMRAVYERMPVLPVPGKQYRAFYDWDGGDGMLFLNNVNNMVRDVQTFLAVNPKADLIFIGHSYGGSAVMDVLRQVTNPHGRIIVVTIDPVSRKTRSLPRQRARGIDYWINIYCDDVRVPIDYVVKLGGVWKNCPQADENIRFLGTARDDKGDLYRHTRPEPLFFERMDDCPETPYERLLRACERLQIGKNAAANGAMNGSANAAATPSPQR